MVRYVVQRLLTMVPVVILVSVGVFSLMHMLPGDPATFMLGMDADAQTRERFRREMGFDQPIYVQYLTWAERALSGDLGRSVRQMNQPVAEAIWQRFPVTLELAILATAFSLLIAIPTGIVAAMRKGSGVGMLSTVLALLGLSLPQFFLALLLIFVFSLGLRWLPTAGYVSFADSPVDNLRHMVLPAFTLGSAMAAIVMRMTRSGLLEELNREYVRTAISKGLSDRAVVSGHALRNALIPVLTIIGVQVGTLLGGAVVVETVFAIPGMGKLIVDSIFAKDFPMVQGVVLVMSIVYLSSNLLIDLAYVYLDPRISYR